MPSEAEQAEMDAAAAALVQKLSAVYEQLGPDGEGLDALEVDLDALEEAPEPAPSAATTSRRSRRRKPLEKEIPIEALPKASRSVMTNCAQSG